MSTSAIGGGGAMDIPDLSSLSEVEQTAKSSEIKQSQQIKDSIQVGEASAEQVEYQATAGKPILPSSVQVKAEKIAVDPEAQQEEFMNKLSDLPPTLRSQLLKDMGKPESERDPELVALEANLNTQSERTLWAKSIHQKEGEQQVAPEGVSQDEIAMLLQEGGESAEVLQKLLGKTLTKPEERALKELLVSGKNLTPEQKAMIAAKLQEKELENFSAEVQLKNQRGEIAGKEQDRMEGDVHLESLAALGLVKLDPASMSSDELQMATRQNGLAMLENQQKVIQATIDSTPVDDPNHAALNDFLKFISEIISECKSFLAKLSTMEAEQGRKEAIGLRETQQAKLEKQMEQIKKAQEMKKKADTLSTVMKIAGPVIAIAMLALVIVSGGSAIAIAVAVMMVVVAIIASTTTIIDDAMTEVTDVIVDAFKSMGMSDEMARIMTMVVIIVLIIALFLVTKGACSQGTGMVSAQIGKEAAKQATTKVANAMALQVAATAVTHSKVIELGMKPLLVDVLGMDEQTADIIIMIVNMIVMLTLMLASAGCLAGAGKAVANSAAGTMGKTAEAISRQLQLLSTAVQAVTQAYSAVANLRMAGMAMEKADLEKIIAELESQQETDRAAKEARKQGIDSLMDLANFYSESFDRLIQSQRKILSSATAA